MIRLFEDKDADQVVNLAIRCFKEINSLVYSPEVIEFMISQHNPERIIHKAKKTTCLVFEDTTKVVGTVSLDKNYIFSLYVNPDFQGKGIGNQLMKSAEDIIFKEYNNITLNASLNSITFYEKIGYVKKEEVYQEDYGTTVLMEKKL